MQQRATNYCSAQSQSMSVSQSPDSVIASDDINVVNTNNNLNNNTVANPVVNQQQPNRVSLSPTNTTRTSSTTTTFQQAPNRNTVVNPYLKQSPNNNNTTQIIIDPILKKKQEFVDRYHLQALQHNQRGRRGDSVKSISALELHTNTQNWRHSWQQRQQLPCATNNQVVSNHTVPLRPRLFLFRRHAAEQQRQMQNINGMQQQQQQNQQQQPEGIWELDTGITELSGEGGSGKTQICLSTCVTCVMTPLLYPTPSSGNGNSAPRYAMNCTSSNQRIQQQNINHYTSIYITMGEGIPPASIARRLEQMVRTRLYNQMGNCNTNEDDTDNQVKDILSRIGLLSIRNEEEFVEFVEVDLPRILAQQKQQTQQQRTNNPYLRQQQQQHTTQTTKIGLIAFDGIAGFFRFSDPTYQHSRNSMFHFQRSSKLLQISSQLRKLSNVFDVPILITNQVTASIPPVVARSNGSNSFDMVSASMLATSSGGGGQQTLPALGLIWSNCVSTRFILQRKDGATFSLDDNVCPNVEQQQNERDVAAGGIEKSQKQTVKKREVRLRKARILQAVNMEKEEREVWYVIDTAEVLAVG